MPTFQTRPARNPTSSAALAAFTMLALLALAPGPAAAANPPIRFSLDMFEPCIRGVAAPGSTVELVWRDSTGVLKAKTETQSAAFGGGWEFCATDPAVWVEPGDTIKASDGTNTRKFSVRNFTLRIDRINDKVLGTGPAGRTIRVCSNWAPYSDFETCHGVRVRQDGTWSFSKFIGYPKVWVYGNWTSPNNDHLSVASQVPWFAVTIGKSTFSGGTAQRASITVTKDGIRDGSGQTVSGASGGFSGQLVNGQGTAVAVAVGDHVMSPSVAPNADWIVPQIDGRVDRVADTVSGKCWDSGTSDHRALVTIFHSGRFRGSTFGQTEEDGTFVFDFHEQAPFGGSTNIIRGDRVVIACQQVGGDLAQIKLYVN